MSESKEMLFTPPSNVEQVTIETGYKHILLDKMFGPLIFHNLRIHADPSDGTWVIERSMGFQHEDDDAFDQWIEWVRIPGQLKQDYQKLTDMDSEGEKE